MLGVFDEGVHGALVDEEVKQVVLVRQTAHTGTNACHGTFTMAATLRAMLLHLEPDGRWRIVQTVHFNRKWPPLIKPSRYNRRTAPHVQDSNGNGAILHACHWLFGTPVYADVWTVGNPPLHVRFWLRKVSVASKVEETEAHET
jgi:hypothetical protein